MNGKCQPLRLHSMRSSVVLEGAKRRKPVGLSSRIIELQMTHVNVEVDAHSGLYAVCALYRSRHHSRRRVN